MAASPPLIDTLPPAERTVPLAEFAVVELLGSRQLVAGQVCLRTWGGVEWVRVQVPAVSFDEEARTVVIPAHNRDVLAKTVYDIQWCDHAQAVEAAHAIRHKPRWLQLQEEAAAGAAKGKAA